MSMRVRPEVVLAVKEAVVHRKLAKSDKQLIRLYPELSRTTIWRIMREAQREIELRAEVEHLCQETRAP